MSKSKQVSYAWPPSFLFRANTVPSNGSQLEERQKLAKFISNLCEELNISHTCVYKAIVCMHRFLMIQSSVPCNSKRLCQACILIACKSEKPDLSVMRVCHFTAKVLKMQIIKSAEVFDFIKNDIIDYLHILIKTLGVGIYVNDPYTLITKRIEEIQVYAELKTTADYLVKQSILLTPFCVKYLSDVIASFCIRLSMEIKSDEIQSIDESLASKEIQSLIYEFCVLFKNYSDKNKQTFTKFDNKVLSYVTHLLKIRSISLAVVIENDSAHSVPNTDEQNVLPSPSSSSTSPALPLYSHDLYQRTTSRTTPINRSSTAVQLDAGSTPAQTSVSTTNKRPNDTSNDDRAYKRSSSSSLSQQQKQ